MMKELAEDQGLTASDYVRTMLRVKFEAKHAAFYGIEPTEVRMLQFAEKLEKLGAPKEATKSVKAAARKIQRARTGRR